MRTDSTEPKNIPAATCETEKNESIPLSNSKASLFNQNKSAHYNDWMRDLARATNVYNP